MLGIFLGVYVLFVYFQNLCWNLLKELAMVWFFLIFLLFFFYNQFCHALKFSVFIILGDILVRLCNSMTVWQKDCTQLCDFVTVRLYDYVWLCNCMIYYHKLQCTSTEGTCMMWQGVALWPRWFVLQLLWGIASQWIYTWSTLFWH